MGRIAVIGAGMGAMAAAARLAVAGHRVVVFERADGFGGALGTVRRDGFAFDTGPGLLLLPAVWRDLFVKTGRTALEDVLELAQVEPATRHVFADGTGVRLPNASRAGVTEALDGALGTGRGARWAAFMNRARDAWDRSRRPLLEEPLWPNWQVLAEKEPYPALERRRLLRRTETAATLAGIARLELDDEPRLRALLEGYALEYGLDPRTAPASAAVLPYLEQTFGTWSVRGGLRALASAVHTRCEERGVEFRFGARAVRIVEKDGRAAGVELADGTVQEAEFVVAGVPPSVLESLLPGVRADGGVPPQSGLPSRVKLLLALRGARPEGTAHRTVVHGADRDAELAALFGPESGRGLPASPTVTVLRPGDPAQLPSPEHESVTVTATVPASCEVSAEDVGRLLERAGRAVEGLAERLLWHEVLGPAEVERDTGAAGGAVPAPALAAAGGRLLHPANSTRLPGLFTVGGWSHPGGGLAHAGMSGALVAGLIVEGPEFRGST
ncbi:phytoene desaturase family protein [Streptomyces sp. NPDC058045]|uniref:phytoene desaturase family protein n=1 Tax=Streptomyces sp. NPDC058045 TaxID=3346311 RepID=UPI0036EFB793